MSHSIFSRRPVRLAMTLAAVLALNMLPVVLAESPPNTAIVPVPKLENDSYKMPKRRRTLLRHRWSPRSSPSGPAKHLWATASSRRSTPPSPCIAIGYPLLAAGFWLAASLAFAEDFPTFAYHEIARIGNHMGQTSLVDVDKDGWVDQVSGSTWFRNPGATAGKAWAKYSNGAIDNSHDVVAADNDGHLDVFSGEGPLGGTGPGGKHRWFIWENVDGRGLTWTEHMILEGPECHEAVAGDVDGDGDLDICSKAWNGDLHIYLRNMLVEHGGKALKPPASR